ncbi:hypothetical protein PRIPAC_77841 [Pristionchus pacificus]|uniref:F-box domain-containing protein n=1 Tax=Pristionchus pacificus TaxID=54126 RepID=A0A2A6CK55_PRIPA|nr:hypothetical protein PRIPAC_77841 [Pristionchus pacificus]|eukprot:PDM78433.1 F-box domain-containing protein [Pristionchus pacificus]
MSLSTWTGSSDVNASTRKPIDFLNLPQNVLEDVFKLLDDRSLSQMREVSKFAKNSVDSSILNVRKTEILYEADSEAASVSSEWHHFIQSVAPPKFNCIIPVLKVSKQKIFRKILFIDSIKFLLNVADIVDVISIYVLNKSELARIFITLIREILNRRCTELHTCEMTHVLSQHDIKTILKIIHTMDKKVSFAGYAIPHESNVYSKVGAYQIEYPGYRGPRTGGTEISIKHVDFEG